MRTRPSAIQTFSLEAVTDLVTMTASGCLPCQQRSQPVLHNQGETLAPTAPVTFAVPSSTPSAETPAAARWSGVIGVEGELTGDGRMIEANALRWESLPIPLRYVSQDVGAHDGAVVVGAITEIRRGDGGAIIGSGDFDMDAEYGPEAARVVGNETCNGVSMDLDDVSFEVRIASELLDDEGMGFPLFLSAMAEGDVDDTAEDEPAEPTGDDEQPVDSDGRVTVMEINSDDEVRVTTDGRIRAATIVAIPAFATAQIHLDSADTADPDAAPDAVDEELRAIVASAVPVAPPGAWFNQPDFAAATPFTVSDTGRVFGHLAQWGTCHLTHMQRGKCVTPPHSASRYTFFHTGTIMTAEGAEIPIGHITLDTMHAGDKMTPAATLTHYEDTGTVVADVVAGEDSYGIWVAGALRPGLTDSQVRALRAAPLSGDWRRIGSGLELVAALAVNVGGFPVPRPAGSVRNGVVTSLVASGMVPPRTVNIDANGAPEALSLDDLRYLKRLADRERMEDQKSLVASAGPDTSADQLARRVRASALKMRVRKASK